jgi:hypothetical protein
MQGWRTFIQFFCTLLKRYTNSFCFWLLSIHIGTVLDISHKNENSLVTAVSKETASWFRYLFGSKAKTDVQMTACSYKKTPFTCVFLCWQETVRLFVRGLTRFCRRTHVSSLTVVSTISWLCLTWITVIGPSGDLTTWDKAATTWSWRFNSFCLFIYGLINSYWNWTKFWTKTELEFGFRK